MIFITITFTFISTWFTPNKMESISTTGETAMGHMSITAEQKIVTYTDGVRENGNRQIRIAT